MPKHQDMRSWKVALCIAAALVAPMRAGAAGNEEPTVAELLRRIEALEKKLADTGQSATPCSCTPSPSAPVVAVPKDAGEPESVAAPSAARTAVAGRVEPTGQQATDKSTEVASTKKSSATAGYDDKGFFVGSSDGNNRVRINGLIHSDARFFIDDDRGGDVNEFFLRRARLDIRAKLLKKFDFRLTPDFSDSELSLKDAYIGIEFADWLELRSGKFKTPFGIERLASSSELVFAERALPDNLVPVRDIGLQLSGQVLDERLEYALAIGNGVPDGDSVDGDVNDGFDVAGRVFATPFAPNQYSPVRGLGFGLAATFGREQGETDDPQLPSFRTSIGRSRFFRYVDDGTDEGTAIADGDHWRISPQATFYEGPLGVLTEYVRSSQQVSLDDDREYVDNSAWQVRGGWLLTGEHARYDGGVEPARPFNFGGGQWGAWEIALRYTGLDVDNDAFQHGFADPEASASRADAFAAAINWYLNRHVVWYFDYEHTKFRGGSRNGDGHRDGEDVLLTRLQLRF